MLRRDANFILLSILLDMASVALAAYLAHVSRASIPLGQPWTAPVSVAYFLGVGLLTFISTFLLADVYNPDRVFRVVDELQAITLASGFAALTMTGVIYFTNRGISRLLVLYFYALAFVFLVSWRLGLRLARRALAGRARPARKRVLLVGHGEPLKKVAEQLQGLQWAGVELVGHVGQSGGSQPLTPSLPHLGGYGETTEVIRRHGVEDVVIAVPGDGYDLVKVVVSELIHDSCNVWIAPDVFSLMLYGSRVENLGGVPMISLKVPTLTGYQRVAKRAFDLVVGGVVTLLCLPMMGLIALAIKLDSPGPVLFRQQRVGENGRLFWMLKFRTMVPDAEQRLIEVLRYDEQGRPIHKRPDDPRVTRVGRVLRRLSLDELPQLFNVLKGEMSLVGPRPEMPWLVGKYEDWQRKRFAVPQGITGWWQVNGRSDKPMHLHTEEDLFYIQNYSILLDLKIMLKTVLVVLRGKGAY